jgi:hypothetical protein
MKVTDKNYQPKFQEFRTDQMWGKQADTEIFFITKTAVSSSRRNKTYHDFVSKHSSMQLRFYVYYR